MGKKKTVKKNKMSMMRGGMAKKKRVKKAMGGAMKKKNGMGMMRGGMAKKKSK
jgi:hypothetical protein